MNVAKTCMGPCGRDLEENGENFYTNGKGGFRNKCKACVCQQESARYARVKGHSGRAQREAQSEPKQESQHADTSFAIISRDYQGHAIAQRPEDGYLNATAMCQATGKLFADYRRLDSTSEFLDALSVDMGIPISSLMEIRKGGARQLQGTWVHPHVAIHLAQWCSARFAVQVSKWVLEIMTKGSVSPNGSGGAQLEAFAAESRAMRKEIESLRFQQRETIMWLHSWRPVRRPTRPTCRILIGATLDHHAGRCPIHQGNSMESPAPLILNPDGTSIDCNLMHWDAMHLAAAKNMVTCCSECLRDLAENKPARFARVVAFDAFQANCASWAREHNPQLSLDFVTPEDIIGPKPSRA